MRAPAGFLVAAWLAVFPAAAQTSVDPARVSRLMQRAVVLDLHDDTIQLMVDEGFDLAQRHDYGQVDIPRMRQGGVTGIFFSIYTSPQRMSPPEAMKAALIQIDTVRSQVRRLSRDLVLATTADEVLAAKKQGKIAALMGLEGGHMIDASLPLLRTYFELGVRYLTLTHSANTPWADSSGDKPAHNGLTPFGREVVREMNRLGMMVDISHVSDKTFYDVIETSTVPVIASHSSCRAVSNAPRNMTDDMLRALAKKGGVVHINYYNGFLDDGYRERSAALKDLDAKEAEIQKQFRDDPRQSSVAQRQLDAERTARAGKVPFQKLIDHFDHAIKVAGIDHVGLGSDFDGVNDQLPEGVDDISKIPRIARALLERGYSDADVEKVLGGNTLRVMREIERGARR
jgi:membrane dipeptidase